MIKTTSSRINTLLGTDSSAKDMQQHLNKLFIQTGAIGDELICTIPSFRGDIAGEADIAEEFARLYGYDNIPSTSANVSMRRGVMEPAEVKNDLVKRYLADSGFYECITYSFAGAQDYEKLCMPLPTSVQIRNPLGDDSALMRQTLAAHMLHVASLNLARKNMDLNLFEISRVYIPVEGEPLPDEMPALCIVQSGSTYDFFTLKGVVENIVRLTCGAEISCTPANAPYLHPGISANLHVGDQCFGVMGEVAPSVAKSFDLDQKVYMAQINLNALYENEKPPIRYTALPRFPAATRDLAVIVAADAGAGDIMNDIAQAGGKRLERVQLFDVYTGEQMEAGSKSLAYSLMLRAPDATMTDAEVDKVMAKILHVLEQKYGAKLR